MKHTSNLNTPLSDDSIVVLYSANNINYDKAFLFSDFIQSLLMLVFDTYVGDEFMNEVDKLNHFNWCWGRNINNFNKEGIIFEDYKNSYDYFLEFLTETFYNIENKDKNKHISITVRTLWLTIFSFDRIRTHSDVDNFIEIYKIMDKTLKK